MAVVLELDEKLLRSYLTGFMGDIRSTYLAHVDRGLFDRLLRHAVGIVVRNWTNVVYHPTEREAARGIPALASDPDWVSSVIVHCFHDAANIVRRELHDAHPELVSEALEDLQWPTTLKLRWCRSAVDAGVVSGITTPLRGTVKRRRGFSAGSSRAS
ncbi:MAG: hypothetical protein KC731_06690 [Myxococcales bacterium]|nr:hypothetical protein [Myxococcales bacterium]MCA9634168.1 hypothetical protein [Myxococcales bacterium]